MSKTRAKLHDTDNFLDKFYNNLHYLGMIVFIVLAYPGVIHIIFRLLQFCIYLTNSRICFYEIEQHIVTILLKERSLFMAGGGTEEKRFSC
jgi:hypothetical protein